MPKAQNLGVKTGDVTLGLNFPSSADLDLIFAGQKSLKVGYNCKVVSLGVPGEKHIDNFPLTNKTHIDTALVGYDDLCADELYIQKLKDGVLQTTARFVSSNQRCWGDDFTASKMVHSFTPTSITDGRKLIFQSAIGKWENVCRNDNCDSEETQTVSLSAKTVETLTNSSSTTLKKEISAGLASNGFSAGAKMSKETTTSVSRSVSTDITKGSVKSTKVKLEYSLGVRNSYGVLSVWEFIVYTSMTDGTVTAVPTVHRGCSDSNFSLAYGPGSPDIDQSCQGALNSSDCSVEGAECTFSVNGRYRVFYGVPGNSISKVADTTIGCNHGAFGYDPVPSVTNKCWGYPITK